MKKYRCFAETIHKNCCPLNTQNTKDNHRAGCTKSASWRCWTQDISNLEHHETTQPHVKSGNALQTKTRKYLLGWSLVASDLPRNLPTKASWATSHRASLSLLIWSTSPYSYTWSQNTSPKAHWLTLFSYNGSNRGFTETDGPSLCCFWYHICNKQNSDSKAGSPSWGNVSSNAISFPQSLREEHAREA